MRLRHVCDVAAKCTGTIGTNRVKSLTRCAVTATMMSSNQVETGVLRSGSRLVHMYYSLSKFEIIVTQNAVGPRFEVNTAQACSTDREHVLLPRRILGLQPADLRAPG
jgi:hypothetical protein